MKERFINSVITEIEGLTAEQLGNVRNVLTKVLDSYDLQESERHLVVYQGYLPQCFKTYLAVKSIEGLSMGTLKLYKYYLEIFFRTVNRPIEEISTDVVRLFLYQYQQNSGCSNRTLDTMRTCLSAFFHWASSEGYVQKDPCASVAPIKYERKAREPLTHMELEQLRQACETSRDSFILEFLYSTGCRVSEFAGVKISDVDIKNHQCTVLGKGNKHRTVFINARCELAMIKYLKDTERDFDSPGYLLRPTRNLHNDNAIDVSAIQYLIGGLGERAGLTRHIHPHLLRHTTATDGISRGMAVEQVQKILGHANIATTMIYAHVDESKLQAEHTRCIV